MYLSVTFVIFGMNAVQLEVIGLTFITAGSSDTKVSKYSFAQCDVQRKSGIFGWYDKG